MSDGLYKLIEEIKIGDFVIDAFNEIQEVLNIFKYNVDEELVELEFENDIKICCTKDHEFLTENRGWVKAIELSEDDDVAEI